MFIVVDDDQEHASDLIDQEDMEEGKHPPVYNVAFLKFDLGQARFYRHVFVYR